MQDLPRHYIDIKKKCKIEDLSKTLSSRITEFFDPERIEKIAREAGFVKRKSKITGFCFLFTILHIRFTNAEISLENLCSNMLRLFNIKSRKQAIDQRLSGKAKVFFRLVLEELLAHIITVPEINNNSGFTGIKVQDSTCFQLPPAMAAVFPGSGGSGSPAAVRIQFEYDMLKRKITTLTVHAFNDQDISNAKANVDKISRGELIIRDLGYIAYPVLRAIIGAKAFFLNRLHNSFKNIKLQCRSTKPLDFNEISRSMHKYKQTLVSHDVWLDNDLPARMIISKLPCQIYAQRLRKAKKEAKNGKCLTKERKTRLLFNIMITNTSRDQIAAEDVVRIYRLRWQIELVFKTWKSYGKLSETKPVKTQRFEAMLYVMLIYLTLRWNIASVLIMACLGDMDNRISMIKLEKEISGDMKEITAILAVTPEMLFDKICGIYLMACEYCKFEKKKNKTSSYEILDTFLMAG